MSHSGPKVTIGMPVYNSERYLEAAIQSILAQTYTNLEIIISDNASTDLTQDICERHAAQDQRITYIRHQTNRGAGWNQSQVAKLATGKYFRWAHYDDLTEPSLVEKCVAALEADPSVVVCYPKAIVIDELGHELKKADDGLELYSKHTHQRFRTYQHLVRDGHECNPLFGVMRTEALLKTALIGSYPSSDIVLLGELSLHGNFIEFPEFLFYKRDHPETSVKAHTVYRERIAWYDPSKRNKLFLTRWKFLLEYLRAIHQASMTSVERMFCYLQMLRWVSWNWRWLSKDLLKAGAWPVLKPLLANNLIG